MIWIILVVAFLLREASSVNLAAPSLVFVRIKTSADKSSLEQSCKNSRSLSVLYVKCHFSLLEDELDTQSVFLDAGFPTLRRDGTTGASRMRSYDIFYLDVNIFSKIRKNRKNNAYNINLWKKIKKQRLGQGTWKPVAMLAKG